jgi:hypothetical protein
MIEVQFQKQSNAADFITTVTAWDDTNNVAFDLTDYELQFGLAACSTCGDDYGWSSTACVVQGGTETGEIEVDADPTTGVFTITIEASELSRIKTGNYRLDVLMKRDDTGPVHLILGQLEIVSSVIQWQ